MKKEMLINASQSEECRIAIVEDGRLEELYVERASQDNYVGNIYKGKVVNLEPGIQAAFVDFGVGRNGFLHISDVEPSYFRQGGYDPEEMRQREREEDRRNPRMQKRRFNNGRPRIKPPIQELFQRGIKRCMRYFIFGQVQGCGPGSGHLKYLRLYLFLEF